MENPTLIPWDHFEKHVVDSPPFEMLKEAQRDGKIVEIKATDVNGEVGFWRLITSEVAGDGGDWTVPAKDILSGTTLPHVIPEAFTSTNTRLIDFVEEEDEKTSPLKPASTDTMEIVGPYEIAFIEIAAAGTPELIEHGTFHSSSGGSLSLNEGWLALEGVFGPEDLIMVLGEVAPFAREDAVVTIRSASAGMNSLPIALTVGRDGITNDGAPVRLIARAA